ncbi:flagellar biosynthesis protein FlhF [Vulcanibacillus modesticaldus]|uniref:Flagellar biosynthesis protein FlhF n=1 Tax=Vulcanibacillus modesticaldus TaxID=337097 RepID=A0A1D2YXL4_9BACI|nr:flagellar biosynthesis protein FlhF [Vulcanibacillus modesticaldus]OEG00418.1 flagellar biosynthesis protein FlhF [Vulcanibacillus modesticaldus]
MKVKKYVVDSLPNAVAQIKKDLGNDAVILQTKKIKVGGILGLFGKKKIEVIAATDSNVSKPINSAKQLTQYRQEFQPNQGSNSNPELNNKSDLNIISKSTPNPQTFNYGSNSKMGKEDNVATIKEEVSELKNLMIKMMINNQDSDNNSFSFSKEYRSVYKRLISQGVDENIAINIIEQVISNSNGRIDEIDVINGLKQEITKRFMVSATDREIGHNTKVVSFVGPTGVGKTTTIAKLAAESVLKHKKRIAFITADTYRIGAIDQLRIYAEILNAPVEVVNSPQDTERAIERLQNYDLIFLDTAGRNYNNEMFISELNNILTCSVASETFLVLSLTHKYGDMLSILEKFKRVDIDKLVFTKFDETSTYGSILNIISKFPYKLSYITYGQNVPDDIEIFNIEKVTSAILGG